MKKILLMDGSKSAATSLSRLFSKETVIISEPFRERRDIREFSLVALCAEGSDGTAAEKIQHLQRAAGFRNIPVVLLVPEFPSGTGHSLPCSGVADIFPLSELTGVLGQILKNKTISDREPTDPEMAYLTPFISATRDVFSTMASMDVRLEQIYFQKGYRRMGDISGVAGLSGRVTGRLAITFSRDLAVQVVSGVMGVVADDVSPELLSDGVGEILTMISGSARRYLTDTPYRFQMALPTIILGRQREIGHLEDSPVAVLVFDAGSKYFSVQVPLTWKKNTAGGQ